MLNLDPRQLAGIVIATAIVLGAVIGLVSPPGSGAPAARTPGRCDSPLCESMTWLWTPVMHRTAWH